MLLLFLCPRIFTFGQVACSGKAEGQGPLLGVLYDEIVRKRWEDLSAKKHSFQPGDVAGEVHEHSRMRAVSLYKTFFAVAPENKNLGPKPEKKRSRNDEVDIVCCVHVVVPSIVHLLRRLVRSRCGTPSQQRRRRNQ